LSGNGGCQLPDNVKMESGELDEKSFRNVAEVFTDQLLMPPTQQPFAMHRAGGRHGLGSLQPIRKTYGTHLS